MAKTSVSNATSNPSSSKRDSKTSYEKWFAGGKWQDTPALFDDLKPMLEVEIVASKGAVICVPRGSLDAFTVTTFRGAVALCLGGPGLIIDLSRVSFIDGAGLTALVGAVRRARDDRTRVAVAVPTGALRKVLDEAGLDVIVGVLETVDLALAEIHDDAGIPERFPSPGACDEINLAARRVCG
jgi:anti-sigma B factor antagonist